jgi:hypothetical protein
VTDEISDEKDEEDWRTEKHRGRSLGSTAGEFARCYLFLRTG